MANLAGDLTKELFGKSEAAKTFRPSWVDMGDYVLYSMVAMGEWVSSNHVSVQRTTTKLIVN